MEIIQCLILYSKKSPISFHATSAIPVSLMWGLFLPGAHVLGLSVAFDSWSAEAAAEFLSLAAPFHPHLHVRCAPLFVVEGLDAVPVQSAPLARRIPSSPFPELQIAQGIQGPEEEEEIVLRKHMKTLESAPPQRDSSSSSVGKALLLETESGTAILKNGATVTNQSTKQMINYGLSVIILLDDLGFTFCCRWYDLVLRSRNVESWILI